MMKMVFAMMFVAFNVYAGSPSLEQRLYGAAYSAVTHCGEQNLYYIGINNLQYDNDEVFFNWTFLSRPRGSVTFGYELEEERVVITDVKCWK